MIPQPAHGRLLLIVVMASFVLGAAAAEKSSDGGSEVVVEGGLDKGAIRSVIKAGVPSIRQCYETSLLQQSKLGEGKVELKLVISASGRVSKAVVNTSTLADPPTEQCMVSVASTWEFPKPKGGGVVIVKYPFVFKQTAADGGEASRDAGRTKLANSPRCLAQGGCDVEKEVAQLCAAYQEAEKLVKAGADEKTCLAPAIAATEQLCCDEVALVLLVDAHFTGVAGHDSVDMCPDDPKLRSLDGGVDVRCLFPKCKAFGEFRQALRKRFGR
ncbi:MAG: AgmX/PglI C-terminal domain-containing protein [Myxococcaceae bacterium]|nr:AgmX/PglI C-terminal domain-containing protein [Myxococcaceae bacterium]